MRDRINIILPDGTEHSVAYEDLDEENIPQLRKPIGGFCWEATDFINLPLSRTPFYIQGWLPKLGKCEIFAPSKTGKSFLAIQIARAIGQGENVLGLVTTQAKVLYLQFELGEETLQQRMRSTGYVYPDMFIGTSFSMKLDTEAGQQKLIAAMEAIQPQVLILDPLYKIMTGEENSSQDMKVITDFLDNIIEAFNCSVLLIHHAGYDISHGRGSTILEGWVDSCIQMKKVSKRGENLRVKITPMVLRHAALSDDPLEAELQNFEFVPVNAPPTILQEISLVLEGAGDRTWTAKEIIGMGYGTRKSVYEAIHVLENRELLRKESRGIYRWIA